MSQPIQLPREIGDGKDREVRTLLSDRRRKLVLIQLRRGALLADHSAKFPITIQAILGNGTLRVGPDAHPLVPGVIVPVDAHVVHSLQAEPAIAILVSFFRRDEVSSEDDTTARFE
jgi:quercetin dioxygenase-like cupin family protein